MRLYVVPRPEDLRKERVGRSAVSPFPFSECCGSRQGPGRQRWEASTMSGWDPGAARPLAVDQLGQRYRRYRLADVAAEEAMARSLQRYGQVAPVVVCEQHGALEVVDGFKRVAAARLLLPPWPTLSVRLLDVDEPGAQAAIYGLNPGHHAT